MRRLTVGLAWALGAAGLVALGPAPADAAPRLVAPYDFDGNGYPDLAVGAPDLRVGSFAAAGGVVVYASSGAGPAGAGQLVTRASAAGISGPQAGDGFGTSVASGDFDRDGYADLAVGQPGRDLPQGAGAGAVTVFYGSAAGLDLQRVTDLPVPKGHRSGAHFGTALAVGDFDGDGRADLAVGAPGDDVQRNPGHTWAASGTVRIYAGSKHGLSASRYDKRRGKRGTGGSGFDVGFGGVLAAGDVTVDGIADLVVGAPGRSYVGTHGYAGWISVCPGKHGGSGSCRRPSMPHAKGYARGWAGMTSLAVGHVWYETPQIIVGSPHFADGDGGRVWLLTLDVKGRSVLDFGAFGPRDVPGAVAPTDRDRFGESVAFGLLQGQTSPRLAVGSPGADSARGEVVVIDPRSDNEGHYGFTTYDQRTTGIPGGSAAGNELGASVALIDHDGNGQPELDIGVPGEDAGTGAVVHLAYDPSVRFDHAERVAPSGPLRSQAAGSHFGAVLGSPAA